MIGDIHAVVCHLKQVNGANQVMGTNQITLDVPGQVAAIKEIELAEPEPDRQAAQLSEWSTG